MYIDWNSPIEAIGPDDNVVPMTFSGHRTWTGFHVTECEPKVQGSNLWSAYGINFDGGCRWRLRNTLNYPTAKPYTPSNEELTQRMEIPQAMAQRMAAHLRECAQVHGIQPRDPTARKLYDEMKSIVSDLPKPVDPIDPVGAGHE